MNNRLLSGALSAALFLDGCAGPEATTPLFALDDCVRVEIVEATSGLTVTGAEDLDIDRRTGRIFISAYDRMKSEKAVARGDVSVPAGGVYGVELAALEDGASPVSVAPLLDPSAIEGGLRPHGIAFDAKIAVGHDTQKRWAALRAAEKS